MRSALFIVIFVAGAGLPGIGNAQDPVATPPGLLRWRSARPQPELLPKCGRLVLRPVPIHAADLLFAKLRLLPGQRAGHPALSAISRKLLSACLQLCAIAGVALAGRSPSNGAPCRVPCRSDGTGSSAASPARLAIH